MSVGRRFLDIFGLEVNFMEVVCGFLLGEGVLFVVDVYVGNFFWDVCVSDLKRVLCEFGFVFL